MPLSFVSSAKLERVRPLASAAGLDEMGLLRARPREGGPTSSLPPRAAWSTLEGAVWARVQVKVFRPARLPASHPGPAESSSGFSTQLQFIQSRRTEEALSRRTEEALSRIPQPSWSPSSEPSLWD